MTVFIALAVAAVLLFAVELVFRAIAHVATDPYLWWHDLFTQRKEDQMRRLARSGGADVVVLGASTMIYGVEPGELGELTGSRCYNASLYRGLPGVAEAWLGDRVLPLLQPKLLVIALCPQEANDNSPLLKRLDEYRESRVFNAGALRRTFHRACHISYAVRYSKLLLTPRALVGALGRVIRRRDAWSWRVPPEIPGALGAFGVSPEFAEREYGFGPNMRDLIRNHISGFADRGELRACYRSMFAQATAAGAKMIFLAMPASKEFIDEMFPGGRRAYEAEFASLRAFANELGVPLIDFADGFEDHEFFADGIHLNGKGRAVWTGGLARGLKDVAGG